MSTDAPRPTTAALAAAVVATRVAELKANPELDPASTQLLADLQELP